MPHPADEPLDVLLGRVLRTLRHRWSQELAAHDLALRASMTAPEGA